MSVRGADCSIVIKTAHREMDIPYAEETLREAFSLLHEQASIEGDGVCKAIRKCGGVTGCFVTPLTIGTAPLLLCLAMGSAGIPAFVSETRSLYRISLDLLSMEDSDFFDLIQDRADNKEYVIDYREQITMERRLYEACRVTGFELRITRGEAVKLKLDVNGEKPPIVYPYADIFEKKIDERFNGDNIVCVINGKKYSNIYGVTVISKKQNGSKTELWIKRSLEKGFDIPEIIDEITIDAKLLIEGYEYRHFGMFKIIMKKLVLVSDETNINSGDAVVGLLRYYVSDTVCAHVFTDGGESIT